MGDAATKPRPGPEGTEASTDPGDQVEPAHSRSILFTLLQGYAGGLLLVYGAAGLVVSAIGLYGWIGNRGCEGLECLGGAFFLWLLILAAPVTFVCLLSAYGFIRRRWWGKGAAVASHLFFVLVAFAFIPQFPWSDGDPVLSMWTAIVPSGLALVVLFFTKDRTSLRAS